MKEGINAWVGEAITGNDGVPEEETGALHCMRVAKGDTREFVRLFERCTASEVLRLYAYQVASEYHRRLTDEDMPDEEFCQDDDDSEEDEEE